MITQFILGAYAVILPLFLGYIIRVLMYEAYHQLGGNGMIDKMSEEIDELHLKRKGD